MQPFNNSKYNNRRTGSVMVKSYIQCQIANGRLEFHQTKYFTQLLTHKANQSTGCRYSHSHLTCTILKPSRRTQQSSRRLVIYILNRNKSNQTTSHGTQASALDISFPHNVPTCVKQNSITHDKNIQPPHKNENCSIAYCRSRSFDFQNPINLLSLFDRDTFASFTSTTFST